MLYLRREKMRNPHMGNERGESVPPLALSKAQIESKQ